MSDYQELIKNFERIRDYMRQFFLYGFKVRGEYGEKSGRTYDNERRRIENYLCGYIRADYTSRGKQVFVHMDSKKLSANPLYAAWKAKSFTDNDLLLHFFLLALLFDGQFRSVAELCDGMAERFKSLPDSQTVRNKCREYERLGVFQAEKFGKTLRYRLTPPLCLEQSPCYQDLLKAVKFCSEAFPFGFAGNTILDREFQENDLFCWKHYFLVHTLEDQVLLSVLPAIREGRQIRFENHSSRSGSRSQVTGIPLRIFVSTQTGRRYLCLYQEPRRRFQNLRLDSISKVEVLENFPGYDAVQKKLTQNLPFCWGVSFGGRSRMETLCMKLFIDEKREDYVLNRLNREGRGGEILRIRENTFLYTGNFFDVNEMLSWVKTFTGRILDLQCSNETALKKITADWERMYRMYGGDTHGMV